MSHYTDNWYPKGTLTEPFLPVSLDEARQVFPAGVGDLMPPADSIPEKIVREGQYTKWGKLFGDMFYSGLESIEFDAKEGIDPDLAWRHIRTIMGSWDPKHEYKVAAIIFLSGLWFDDVRWTPKARS